MGTLLTNSECHTFFHLSYTTHSMSKAKQQALSSADVWLTILERSLIALGCKLFHVYRQPKHLQCSLPPQLNSDCIYKGTKEMRSRKDCYCNLSLEDGAHVSLPGILSSSMISFGFLPQVEPGAQSCTPDMQKAPSGKRLHIQHKGRQHASIITVRNI